MDEPEVAAGREAEGELAERLLVAQRFLAGLGVTAEVRIRLNLRFTAICDSLKVPGCRRDNCVERLERLMAEAREAAGSGTDD